jgi:hypothetical protein
VLKGDHREAHLLRMHLQATTRCQSLIPMELRPRHLLITSIEILEILGLEVACIYVCMQDDQNGQKTMVLSSADKIRLTPFILSVLYYFSSKLPSLAADGNTIIYWPWYVCMELTKTTSIITTYIDHKLFCPMQICLHYIHYIIILT